MALLKKKDKAPKEESAAAAPAAPAAPKASKAPAGGAVRTGGFTGVCVLLASLGLMAALAFQFMAMKALYVPPFN